MENKTGNKWRLAFLVLLTAACCLGDYIVIKKAWAPYSVEGGVTIVSLILAGLLDIPAAFLGSGIKKNRQGLSRRGELLPWVLIISLALAGYILLRVFSAKTQTDAYGIADENMKNVSTFILSLLPAGTTVLSMAVAYAFSDPLGELISKKEQIKDAAEKAVRNAESDLESLFPKVSASDRLQAYDEMDGKNQTNKLCEAADLALEGERYVRERLMEICQDPATASYLSRSREAEVFSKMLAACNGDYN